MFSCQPKNVMGNLPGEQPDGLLIVDVTVIFDELSPPLVQACLHHRVPTSYYFYGVMIIDGGSNKLVIER
jgi:hypothetical protein